MRYLIPNGAMPTTAAPVPVTTGSVIKTMLQWKPLVTCRVCEVHISFDLFAAKLPIRVEVIETDVAATVTALAEADITKLDSQDSVAATVLSLGTAATGYTASAEGSITVVRQLLPPQLISPTNQFVFPISLGCEPRVYLNKFGRIRVTADATAVANCYCAVVVEI